MKGDIRNERRRFGQGPYFNFFCDHLFAIAEIIGQLDGMFSGCGKLIGVFTIVFIHVAAAVNQPGE